MITFIKRINPMLLDLLSGCLMYGIVGELIIFILVSQLYSGSIAKVAVGFLFGVLLMLGLTVHMYKGIEVSIMLGEAGAQKHTLKMYAIRIAVVAAVVLLIYFTDCFNAIALVIGMISLKVAAYLQPFTHRYIVSKILE